MKKIIFSIFTLSTCFILAEEKTTTTPDDTKKEKEKSVLPLPTDKQQQRSIMIIEPKARAEDFIKSFEMLKKDKPSSRIYYKLFNNQTINNIIDINMLDNGTLILFKIATTQGTKFLIVPTEDIESIGHL